MRNEENEKLAIESIERMLEGQRVAMLATVGPDGSIRSRPMACATHSPSDGAFWFFTDTETSKVAELEAHPRVNVSFVEPSKRQFVSISGHATRVEDRQKIESWWDPEFEKWIPGGRDNPDLALLRVQADRAEYWDEPTTTMRVVGGLANKLLAGRGGPTGEHGAVDMSKRK